MPDTLAKRIDKARATMNKLPNWISFNARFEGGENLRANLRQDQNLATTTKQANKLSKSHVIDAV